MRHLLALPLAILATAPLAAQQFAAPSYRALGTEPFWTLTIGDGLIRLEEPGKRPTIVSVPAPRPTFNGRRYEARTLTVDITNAPCSDGMTDRRYPDTVTIDTGRRTLHGCGGAPETGDPRTARLDGTAWRIEALDGRPINQTRPTRLAFADGRLSGNAGCNQFGGSYTITGARLVTDRVFATRMACPGKAMQTEARILALLEQPLTLRPLGRATLILAGEQGSITLTRTR